MTSEQRCGTCRWGQPASFAAMLVECQHPIPLGLGRVRMRVTEGTDCPCYQPAPAQQPEECPDAD